MIAAAAALLFATATASAQTYTISAKPGVLNYIEGTAFLNGSKLSEEAVRATFLAAGDSVSTSNGKVEILLTPGVFLRVGDNSEIRMISPSLTNTQVAIVQGEAIIEAAGLLKDNSIQVTDHGATVTIEKNGLYRFNADNPPSVAVLEGKALVYFGEKKVEMGKDREVVIGDVLSAEKFDPKQEDELYAWSNVRSEYEAAATYQSAKAVSTNGFGGGWGIFGYSGLYGPGWFWNNAFDCWAWMPPYGAFYSPFGWGFYSPGVVAYAPIVVAPVYRGGHWEHHPGPPGNPNWKNQPGNPNWKDHHWVGRTTTASVPVRLDHPPAVGVIPSSAWAAHEARVQAARSLASTGAFNPAGASNAAGTVNPRMVGPSAFAGGSHISTPNAVAVRGGNWAGGRVAGGGGWTGGRAGGFSGASHAGGGGFAGGAAHGGGGFSGGGGGGGHAGGGGAAAGGGAGGGHH